MTHAVRHSKEGHTLPSSGSGIGAPGGWPTLVAAAAIALTALLLYLPSIRFGFVGWDDTRYIGDSTLITQTGGLARIWTTGEAEQYYPLTFTSFWIEYRLWGDRSGGYHATNVFLHAANAVLLLFLLRRLGLARWTACAVCLLFVVHPVQVQSVAWIAERKNLLSSFFTLAALLAWCRIREPARVPDVPSRGLKPAARMTGRLRSGLGFLRGFVASWLRGSSSWYAMSFTAFVAAMLSKTAVLTLPLALITLDRCIWRITWRRSLGAVAPFILPAVALAFITAYFEQEFVDWVPAWTIRPLIAAAALWFYAAQLFAPLSLLPIHPRWEVSLHSVGWWFSLVSLTAAILVLWRWRRRLGPLGVYGLIHFVVFLLPVLGFVGYGNLALTFVSDHYLYLPSIGIFLALVALLDHLRAHWPATRKWITGIGCVVLMSAATMTLRYLPVFTNGETTWTRTLEGNPQCPAAHAGMGRVYEERENWPKALEHYEKVTELSPHVEAYLDVARVLRRTDRWDQAENTLLAAREKYPQSLEPLIELARMAQRTQRLDRAEEMFRHTLELDPRRASVHVELASLYLGLGRREEAEKHFIEATVLDPRTARAYVGLATSLRVQRRFAEAVATLRAGLRSVPGDLRMLNLLARILATTPEDAVRNGAEAVLFAEEADRRTHHGDYEVLDTLAAAFAETGRWNEAVETALAAIQLAQRAGDAAFTEALHRRLEGYRHHEPLREITTTVYRSR